MKRKRPWLDSYILESTFNQVATLCDWKYAKFVKVRVGEGKRPWTDLTRIKAQTLEFIEFDYMVCASTKSSSMVTSACALT